MFSSGPSTPRGSFTSMGELTPLAQYLSLDSFTIEYPKYTRLGELRRALGIPSFGSTAEDNSFGAAHSKPAPTVGTEELKRFKASVTDTSHKARLRAKKLDESLHKLNKYCEASNLKKQQRNEMITNERSGGLNLLKIGTHNPRNPSDPAIQKVEDRTKNLVLNKRVRSSVAEIRAEGQTTSPARRSMIIGKDRDMLRDCDEGSDLVEEKIRRLPAGGETWDRKMKRKRSVGPLLGRPLDEGEPKRVMLHKLNNDLDSKSCDAQTYRSGSSNGTPGINKLDGISLSASSNGRAGPKNEVDKISLSRDSMAGLSRERLKGNNKLSVREDNQMLSPNPMMKGKASRAPRSGPVIAGNSSPNFPRTSGSLECWEQPASVNKIHSLSVANNRSRPIPTGSSSPPMAQWVGQRPQKISRTRRANLVSPVSNYDEVQTPEGCSPSELGTRFTFSGTNGSPAKCTSNGVQQFKVKLETNSSPVRLSESEESGACENREIRLKEKGAGNGEVEDRAANSIQNIGPSTLHTKKNKITIKEESGDGIRRQGRSGRGSSFPRVNISPVKEKLENMASVRPLKSVRPGSEKNGSKSGRPPLKKVLERKAFARLGNAYASGSPDFADDDHEELLAAANFACNASYLACSSPFWKKMQPMFASVRLDQIYYLKEQLNATEDNCKSSSQMFDHANNVLNNFVHEDNILFQDHLSGKKEKSVQDHGLDSGKRKIIPPLYQRVLSALIVEDEAEEFEENCGGRLPCFQSSRYSTDADFHPPNTVGIEFEHESVLSPQMLRQCAVDRFSCNGSSTYTKSSSISNQLFNNGLLEIDQGVPQFDNGMFTEFSENGVDGPVSIYTNASGISSIECPYEQMCLEDKLLLELQSVGLYPEMVPDLADGDDEALNSDIVRLQKGLYQQVDKTKVQLRRIIKTIEEANEEEKRGLEQVAMESLIELSYKKLLATRGSLASKLRVAKIPKPVAVAYMKRTLARCRKFEDTGKSCFSEPPLRDVIYAAPPCGNDAEFTGCIPETQISQSEFGLSGLSNWAEQHDHRNDKTGRNYPNLFGSLTHPSDQDFAKTGPIMNRGKKKELLLDDVGGSASIRATSNFGGNLLGGSKGKRSEREREKEMSARNAKAGHLSLGNSKGERKTKTKPKQKTAQLSSSGNGSINNNKRTSSTAFGELGGNGSRMKREPGLNEPPTNIKEPMEFTNLPLNELDPIELGVDNDLGGHQDLSTWLNIDEDVLQDNDAVGLEIPMDDLSELSMLL
ncbi:hypothetical protein UlMin_025179 [Ulmus minor]